MVTLDEVLEEVRLKGVCPMPDEWNRLYQMLPGTRQTRDGWVPPLPLILGAWWETGMLQKSYRFEEHLQWADKHGALMKVYRFLQVLPEDRWHQGH
jgi:hypothetical protein